MLVLSIALYIAQFWKPTDEFLRKARWALQFIVNAPFNAIPAYVLIHLKICSIEKFSIEKIFQSKNFFNRKIFLVLLILMKKIFIVQEVTDKAKKKSNKWENL